MTDLFSKDGYLLDRYQWNQSMAELLAQKDHLVLLEDHWIVLLFLRDFYEQHHTMPAQRLVVKHLLIHSQQTSVDSIYLHHLFPKGLYRQGALLAGLPKPARCL